jgi:hypothetical protein
LFSTILEVEQFISEKFIKMSKVAKVYLSPSEVFDLINGEDSDFGGESDDDEQQQLFDNNKKCTGCFMYILSDVMYIVLNL